MEELGVAASFVPGSAGGPLMFSQATTAGVSAEHTEVDFWRVLDGDAELPGDR